MSPPDNALVLCVDDRSQIQALNRTQPLLPRGLDRLSVARTTTSDVRREQSDQ